MIAGEGASRETAAHAGFARIKGRVSVLIRVRTLVLGFGVERVGSDASKQRASSKTAASFGTEVDGM